MKLKQGVAFCCATLTIYNSSYASGNKIDHSQDFVLKDNWGSPPESRPKKKTTKKAKRVGPANQRPKQ